MAASTGVLQEDPLMSANGAVWRRVRSRFRAFPERLAACEAEVRSRVFRAAAYGRCVQAFTAPGGRLSKDLCAREFEALRSCFVSAELPNLPALCEGKGKVFALSSSQERLCLRSADFTTHPQAQVNCWLCGHLIPAYLYSFTWIK